MAKNKRSLNETPSNVNNNNDSNNKQQQIIIVLPGDNVTKHIGNSKSNQATKIRYGNGLSYDAATKQVHATIAGRLIEHTSSINNNASTSTSTTLTAVVSYFFIQQQQGLRRYLYPNIHDRVIGVILDRVGADGAGGDNYRVSIGGIHTAVLSNMSFDGATKRNKPHLQPGQVVYARVVTDHDGLLDPILSCQLGPLDVGQSRKDWMTNEGCYGELKGGTLCKISTGLARALLDENSNNNVFSELNANKLAFEVAIGVNGYLWIHSSLPDYTVLIQNAVQNSAVMTPQQVKSMVKSLVYTVQKQVQRRLDAMSDDDDGDVVNYNNDDDNEDN